MTLDPASTEPATTEPATTEPATTEPATTNPAPPAETRAGTGNRGLKMGVVALASLSFALAVLAATISASNRDDGREASVRRAAGAFGTAILTYDFENVSAWRRSVVRLSTGVFRKQFESYSESLGTIFVNTQNSSEVRDVDIFLNDVDEKAATAIVVVDTTTSGVSGTGRRVTAYLQLDLVNTGNGWLVDGLTNLNLGAAPAGSGAPTTTPTTSRR